MKNELTNVNDIDSRVTAPQLAEFLLEQLTPDGDFSPVTATEFQLSLIPSVNTSVRVLFLNK